MGKTYRAIPHWAKVEEVDDTNRDPRSVTRMQRFNRRVIQRRDGGFGTELGMAENNTPHGYNTWDPVWGMHRKRDTKARTHRLARRTFRVDTSPYNE